MAADLLAEGLGLAARGLWRFIVWLGYELFFDLLLERTGRFVLTRLRIVDEPGELLCVCVGLLLWLAVAAVWLLW